jgi:hypothetical protein
MPGHIKAENTPSCGGGRCPPSKAMHDRLALLLHRFAPLGLHRNPTQAKRWKAGLRIPMNEGASMLASSAVRRKIKKKRI